MRELGQLAERESEFARVGVRVYALSVDRPEDLADLQKKLGTAVTLLADPDGQAVRALGMIDPEPFPARVQARAGTFWIDRDGVLRARWFTGSYRDRPDPDKVLAEIRSGL